MNLGAPELVIVLVLLVLAVGLPVGLVVLIVKLARGPRQAPAFPAGTAPGWYPDPANGSVQRWWDGARWTEQTAPPPGGTP